MATHLTKTLRDGLRKLRPPQGAVRGLTPGAPGSFVVPAQTVDSPATGCSTFFGSVSSVAIDSATSMMPPTQASTSSEKAGSTIITMPAMIAMMPETIENQMGA
ncbi:hypothetical protein ABID74_002390 [Gordonia terrae]